MVVFSPEEIKSEARLESLRNRAIPKSASASKGVYSTAVEVLCKGDQVPNDRIAPCTKLKSVLAGGVDDDEVDDLDAAVKELNVALGVTPANEK